MKIVDVKWSQSDSVLLPDSNRFVVYWGGSDSQFPFHWPDYLTVDDRQQIVGNGGGATGQVRLKARAFIRYYCSKVLRKSPKDFQFSYNESGKPFIPDIELEFNLSHTDTSFMVAFTKKSPVGIDLEQLQVHPDLEDLMSYAFSASERAFVDGVGPGPDFLTRFYMIWTSKEAILKAAGTGLTNDLSGLNLFNMHNSALYSRFLIRTFMAPDGQIASLVTDKGVKHGNFLCFSRDKSV